MVEAENPYAPPETDPVPGRRVDYVEIDTRTLGQLYTQLRSVKSVGAIFFLVAFVAPIAAFQFENFSSQPVRILAALISFLALGGSVGITGMWAWGRISGLALCLFLLIPAIFGGFVAIMSVLIATVGLIVLARAQRLFGPEEFRVGRMRRELVQRRKYGVN